MRQLPLDTTRLDQAAREAGMSYCTGSINHVRAQVGSGLTPEEIRYQSSTIEFLVCELIQLSDYHDYQSDDALFELHNAMVGQLWQELDLLAYLAGGNRTWAGMHGHGPYFAPCDSPELCTRNEFARACNRLYAEVEPGAHIAQIEVTVHTADGTEVSYATSPRPLDGSRNHAPIWRTIHTADHDGCMDATVDDTPDADETSGEEEL